MLYEDFWKSSCNWRKTTIFRSMTNTIENRKAGKRQWLTRKQMLPVFDHDEGVVDGIITRKRSDKELRASEVRKHPEHPDLYQYLVLTEDYEEASESDKIMDKFRMREQDDESDSSDDVSSSGSDSGDSSDDDDDEGHVKGKKGSKKKKSKDSGKKPKSKVHQSM